MIIKIMIVVKNRHLDDSCHKPYYSSPILRLPPFLDILKERISPAIEVKGRHMTCLDQ